MAVTKFRDGTFKLNRAATAVSLIHAAAAGMCDRARRHVPSLPTTPPQHPVEHPVAGWVLAGAATVKLAHLVARVRSSSSCLGRSRYGKPLSVVGIDFHRRGHWHSRRRRGELNFVCGPGWWGWVEWWCHHSSSSTGRRACLGPTGSNAWLGWLGRGSCALISTNEALAHGARKKASDPSMCIQNRASSGTP